MLTAPGQRKFRRLIRTIALFAGIGSPVFLAAADGPRIAVIEANGWDTHANQGGAVGGLANRLRQLDGGIASFKSELGSDWSKTTVLIVTVF